jgi:SAM-dependent methyltransferase
MDVKDERFEFGDNWQRFLKTLTEEKIAIAQESICELFSADSLAGKTFLDIGSGSGLFSLAAMRLGARKVHSFDYDPKSVACTRMLKERYFPDTDTWVIEQGSALDEGYMASLGKWDIVYSWGVLHHTGDMWQALENAGHKVVPGGWLCTAIYNDQGVTSRRWTKAKRTYNQLPPALRFLVLYPAFVNLWGINFLLDLRHGRPFHSWKTYQSARGMSPWEDVIDWVGGYPFEVAQPEEIFHFYRRKGYVLQKLKTCGGGKGCNEFVFRLDE